MPGMSSSDRRVNVQRIIDQQFNGVVADFARKVERQPAQVWQFLNERNIGEKLARDLEVKLGLDPGTLDNEAGASGLAPDEDALLRDYRAASDGWKLTVRLMARTPPEEQPQLSKGMNILMTTIFGKAVPDSAVEATNRSSPHGAFPSRKPVKK